MVDTALLVFQHFHVYRRGGWTQSSPLWAIPPVRLGLSRRNSRKFRKTPETLSERFLEFPSRVRLGSPKPYNLRHLTLPEHFQNSLPPPIRLETPLFFKNGSGEGLAELVMEFPAVLRVFLTLNFEWDQILRFVCSVLACLRMGD